MKRDIDLYLNNWLSSPNRKPLVIRGARQVGKTHSVRELAQRGGYQLVEINLDLEATLHTLFALEPKRFLSELSAIKGIDLNNQTSLLFIDEIQAYPKALATLRYFKELLPELPVIAAGSLLDFALSEFEFSMPVGRVEFLYMYPLTFSEFIRAVESVPLAEAWATTKLDQPLSEALHIKFLEALRTEYFVGGMPEVVAKYISTHSILEVQKTQAALVQTFESDFAKYGSRIQLNLLRQVFRKLPALVGKKIKYVTLSRDHRAAQVKAVLELLRLAGLCHLVYRTAANGIPLGAEADENHYKAIFLDVGLMHHILGLRIHDSTSFTSLEMLATVMEGAVAEQFVGQEFMAHHAHFEKKQLYYWHREAKNSNAEVDYLDSWGERVVPCEVKAGGRSTLKSLQVFLSEREVDVAYRLWINNVVQETTKVTAAHEVNDTFQKQSVRLSSFPLYCAGRLFGRDAMNLR